MTIEFWPRSLLTPRSRPKRPNSRPRSRRPKLPIRVGKAHQLLSTAIICSDHELASWLDLAVMHHRVVGEAEQLAELRKRLDEAMEPLPAEPPAPAIA